MSKKSPSKRYPSELKERAVRMVRDLRREVRPPGGAGSDEGVDAGFLE